MPCHAAMIENFITVSQDESIEKAIKALKKAKAEAAAVVNGKGAMVGLFSYKILLTNLLPVNIAMAGGEMAMAAAPGVAKRLRKVKPLPVQDLMATRFTSVYPETSTWEGLRLVLDNEHPVIVIDRDSNKPLGIITEHSLYNEFERMQD